MKTLQITFACLLLLVGQVLLSDAKDPEPMIVPAPEAEIFIGGIPLTSVDNFYRRIRLVCW